MQRLEVKDTLENIANDLKSLSNITMFMGIGCKEYQIETQEMWFLSETLERISTALQELRESL